MKGIMFKEDLFHKVIAGEKTETRRVIKLPKDHTMLKQIEGAGSQRRFKNERTGHVYFEKPRYQPGEVVYLKEPYAKGAVWTDYAYDHKERDNSAYKNKMFMPASAARYFIRITTVEVERLQDIENDGIRREGVEIEHPNDLNTLLASWILLWDGINKTPYAWGDNPWVWVYKFELIP